MFIGLDLPMKVLDMLGAGLVVCAARYYAINELITHKKNGYLFNNSKDLTSIILKLVKIASPKENEENYESPIPMIESTDSMANELDIIRQQVGQENILNWYENWDQVIKPLVESIMTGIFSHGVAYNFVYLTSMLSMILLVLAYISRHITNAIT